jgi:hypothetical protein
MFTFPNHFSSFLYTFSGFYFGFSSIWFENVPLVERASSPRRVRKLLARPGGSFHLLGLGSPS